MITIEMIILAFLAGMVGATLGGTQAFVFAGFTGLAGMGVATALNVQALAAGTPEALGIGPIIGNVAFGTWFHPAMAFMGCVGAGTYAKKMGYVESGKAAGGGLPLIELKKPDVLLFAGVIAVLGYVGMTLLTGASYAGIKADGGAIIIWPLSLLIKLVFEGTLTGKVPDEIKSRYGGRFSTNNAEACWLPWMRKGFEKFFPALAWGGVSGFATWQLLQIPATAPFAPFIGFFVSAATLFMLLGGMNIAVSHHLSLPASYAVAVVYAANPNATFGEVMLWGLAFAVLGAFLADFLSDCFHVYGDTHIDPPAMAICTTSFILQTIVAGSMLQPGSGAEVNIILPLVIIAAGLVLSLIDGAPKKVEA